jgi:hypothetical protein
VVLFSIVVHGFSPLLLPKGPRSVAPSPGPKTDTTVLPDKEYLTIDEYVALKEAGAPVTVVDARTERTLDADDETPSDSVRIHPEQSVSAARALSLPRENVLAVLCA